MACHIRKNEVVEVISGAHRGQRGKVLRVDRDRDVVLIEGVNVVFRHVRPSRRNPQGGRVEKEAPIHISNVLRSIPRRSAVRGSTSRLRKTAAAKSSARSAWPPRGRSWGR
jgi:large subunit ribosomal protein L24